MGKDIHYLKYDMSLSRVNRILIKVLSSFYITQNVYKYITLKIIIYLLYQTFRHEPHLHTCLAPLQENTYDLP